MKHSGVNLTKHEHDFPGIQRLRLYISNAGGVGLIPDQGTKIPHAAQYSQTKQNRTTNPLKLSKHNSKKTTKFKNEQKYLNKYSFQQIPE